MTLVAAVDFGAWFDRIGGWSKLAPYLGAVAVLGLGWLLARSATAAIERFGGKSQAGSHNVLVVRKLVFYAIMILTVILALNQIGVKLSGLLAAAGIVTVAVSFAAQTSVSNVISGIFLLFDRPFSLGDTIKVDTTLGAVLSIGLLSSKVRTFDNLVVRIPNEALLKSTITNYSLLNVRRLDVSVLVDLSTDLKRAHELLLEVMREHVKVLDEPAPAVLTDAITDSGITLIARVWVMSTDFIQARSDLSTSAVLTLREAGIERPRMRREVWTRPAPGFEEAPPAQDTETGRAGEDEVEGGEAV